MDNALPVCPLCPLPTDEPRLPCAECNKSLPHSVQDWLHKAWFDGTITELTHDEVGETLRIMRVACLLSDDPNLDVTALWPGLRVS